MRVAISGATGFIGGRLCRWFAARGADVHALARRPIDGDGPANIRCFHCDLPDHIDERALDGGIDAFIHCAYAIRGPRALTERTNVSGSERLVQLCRSYGVPRLVFLSSMSAHEGAESDYARSKRKVEAILDPSRDLIVRPGLVVGTGGMFWRLCELVRRFRVIPILFGGGQLVQTIAVDDLCCGIGAAVDRRLTGAVDLGEDQPVTLDALFAAIARMLRVRVTRIRLPGYVILSGLNQAERLGLRLPISSEDLRGLKALRPFDVAAGLRAVGLTPKRMQESVEQLWACAAK